MELCLKSHTTIQGLLCTKISAQTRAHITKKIHRTLTTLRLKNAATFVYLPSMTHLALCDNEGHGKEGVPPWEANPAAPSHTST